MHDIFHDNVEAYMYIYIKFVYFSYSRNKMKLLIGEKYFQSAIIINTHSDSFRFRATVIIRRAISRALSQTLLNDRILR